MSPPIAAPRRSLPTILVVDDDPDLRESVCEVLSAIGYSVQSAANGVEGLRAARMLADDAIILLDLNMPILNGSDMLKRLRADPGLSHLKVIVVTANTAHLPADVTLLKKPFDQQALVQALERARQEA